MEKKTIGAAADRNKREQSSTKQRSGKKVSEYGRQLQEKQKVKNMYGLRERQFVRFFDIAIRRREGATGENLLNLLERRIDNVTYRLKMAKTREQARQMVVHGHIFVNGKKVNSPSYMVSVNDAIALNPKVIDKAVFLEQVIDKRMKIGIKVPEWLELDKKNRIGYVLRNPVRSDIQVPIEEHLIVELYSK